MPYFWNKSQKRITWNEYLEPDMLKKAWKRCRGSALEYMIRHFVEEILHRKMVRLLNLQDCRYEINDYFFDGTDADLLLREIDPSSDNLEAWKRHWIIFNIKTTSEQLLEQDSLEKFRKLCQSISEKENKSGDKCSLILVAAIMEEETIPRIRS